MADVTQASQRPDDDSQDPDGLLPVRLRVNVFDSAMALRGIRTVGAQARLVGVGRSTMFRIRNGTGEVTLSRALRMAELCRTTVDDLFERVEVTA